MRPAVDATLTMLPPFSRRYGRAAWQMRKVPVRLTARMRCQSSKEASTVWANLPMPATLHTVFGAPSWATTSFIDVATDSGSLTSVRTAIALPPAALISSTVSWAPSSEMSRAATFPPSPAISSAVARPSPEPAPVTTATRPPKRPPSGIRASVCDDPSASQTRHGGELLQFALDVAAARLHGELCGASLFHRHHAVREV